MGRASVLIILGTRISNPECYTRPIKTSKPLAGRDGRADRSNGRFTMEPQTLTGPLLYLLIVWGVVTAVFLVLLLRRSVLASQEGDEIFFDVAAEHLGNIERER